MKIEPRESFVFYRSFFEAIDALPDEFQLEAYRYIVKYALDGELPKEEKSVAKSVLNGAKKSIDDAYLKYLNSLKGGRKPNPNQSETKGEPKANQTQTKPKPNPNQSETKGEPYVYVYEYVNDNNINTCASDNAQECDLEPIEDAADQLFKELWSIYPQHRGKSRISKTAKRKLLKHGREQMIRAINRYVDECNAEKRYIQNGSTFFNGGYQDYLDDTFTPIVSKKQFDRDEKLGDWQGTDYDAAVLDGLGGGYDI